MKATQEAHEMELHLAGIIEAIYQKYGYDFRRYSEAHIKRRIMNRLAMTGLKDISQVRVLQTLAHFRRTEKRL